MAVGIAINVIAKRVGYRFVVVDSKREAIAF
jgi:hypothetical protein